MVMAFMGELYRIGALVISTKKKYMPHGNLPCKASISIRS